MALVTNLVSSVVNPINSTVNGATIPTLNYGNNTTSSINTTQIGNNMATLPTGLLADPTKLVAPTIAGQTSIPVSTVAAPAPVQTDTYTGAQVSNPNDISAATSTAGLSTAQTRTIGDNEILSKSVNNLIDANSPLMQQAATRAKQQANASGLLNSSMAVGASQGAVMDKAIDIGKGDTAAYTNVADRNLANQQQSNTLNAQQTQQNNQFNANSTNNTNQFNTGNDIRAGEVNAASTNSANSQNAQATNANAQFSASATARANEVNANATNATSQYNATAATDVNKANAQLDMQIQQMNLDAQTKTDLANLDTNTKLSMADIEANYKTLMQADASLGTMYTQMIKNVTDITMNKDMDAVAKQKATDLQTNSFKTYANMTAAMNNLNIDTLLNFGSVTATTTPATNGTTTPITSTPNATAPATLPAGSAGLPTTNITNGQVVNIGGANYQLTGYSPAIPAVYGLGMLSGIQTTPAKPEVLGTWTKI